MQIRNPKVKGRSLSKRTERERENSLPRSLDSDDDDVSTGMIAERPTDDRPNSNPLREVGCFKKHGNRVRCDSLCYCAGADSFKRRGLAEAKTTSLPPARPRAGEGAAAAAAAAQVWHGLPRLERGGRYSASAHASSSSSVGGLPCMTSAQKGRWGQRYSNLKTIS